MMTMLDASQLSSSTSAADFPLYTFSKAAVLPEAASVVMIINLIHIIKDCEDLREGACASDRWNIGTNTPHFCLQVVCKMVVYFQELMVCTLDYATEYQ